MTVKRKLCIVWFNIVFFQSESKSSTCSKLRQAATSARWHRTCQHLLVSTEVFMAHKYIDDLMHVTHQISPTPYHPLLAEPDARAGWLSAAHVKSTRSRRQCRFTRDVISEQVVVVFCQSCCSSVVMLPHIPLYVLCLSVICGNEMPVDASVMLKQHFSFHQLCLGRLSSWKKV